MSEVATKPTCADEHGEFFEHCDACRADHDALLEVLAEQARESDEIVKRLAQSGVQMPAHLILMAQVEALTEAIHQTRRSRMAYEYVVGEKVLTQLREGQKQLAKHTDALVVPDRKLTVVKK